MSGERSDDFYATNCPPRSYDLRRDEYSVKQLREHLQQREEEHTSMDRRELDILRNIRLSRQGKLIL